MFGSAFTRQNGEFAVPSRLGSDLSRPLQFRERRFFRNVVDFTDSAIRACCQGNRCSDVFDVTSRRTPCRHFVEQQNSRAPVHHSFEHGKEDRKSTRLNSSHVRISYAVFCLKKKKKIQQAR